MISMELAEIINKSGQIEDNPLLDEVLRLRALNEEVDRLRALVLGIEWVFSHGEGGDDEACPFCYGGKNEGHAEQCKAFSAPGVLR